jgi:hypothetical protein
MRWTQAAVDALQKRKPLPVTPSKYRNKPTEVGDRRFASMKEANYYISLKLMQACGQIRGFACQVSVPLPSGKRRMVIDFLIVNTDGTVRWVDVKGYATDTWLTKKDELEHSLGITIEIA